MKREEVEEDEEEEEEEEPEPESEPKLAIGSHTSFDKHVAPLLAQLITVCNFSKPELSVVCMATMMNEEEDESIHHFCLLPKHASPLMADIGSIVELAGGKFPRHLMPNLMMMRDLPSKPWPTIIKDTNSDLVFKSILKLSELISQACEKYTFPLALVIQSPQAINSYIVVGKWPSQEFEGIQFARVLGKCKGYTEEAVKTLCGEKGAEEANFMVEMAKMGKNIKALESGKITLDEFGENQKKIKREK